jgi:hypothetical protein
VRRPLPPEEEDGVSREWRVRPRSRRWARAGFAPASRNPAAATWRSGSPRSTRIVIHDPRGYLRCFSDTFRPGKVACPAHATNGSTALACVRLRILPVKFIVWPLMGVRHGRGSRENQRDARPASVWLSMAMDGDRRREERRQQEPAEAAGPRRRGRSRRRGAAQAGERGAKASGQGLRLGGSVNFPGLSCRRPWTNVNMPICRSTSPRMRAGMRRDHGAVERFSATCLSTHMRARRRVRRCVVCVHESHRDAVTGLRKIAWLTLTGGGIPS